MYQSDYFITRSEGTYSEILLTQGLARVLQEILGHPSDITIINEGIHFRLRCSQPVTKELVDSTGSLVLLPFIKGKENDNSPVHYNFSIPEGREQRKVYWEKVRAKAEDIMKFEPSPVLEIAEGLSSLKALSTYNKIAEFIQSEKKFVGVLINCILCACSENINNWDNALVSFKKDIKTIKISCPAINALQVVNPDKGKGINATKQGKINPGAIRSSFPVEFLKYVGLYNGSIIKHVPVGSGKYDKKIFVLEPVKISFNTIRRTITEFRSEIPVPSPVKVDIAVVLGYTKKLLNYIEQEKDTENPLLFWEPRNISKIVGGFSTCYFKNMGNADAVSNLSFLGLPGWVHLTAENKHAEIEVYKSVIEEHEKILVKGLDEDGQTIAALKCYREFLSGSQVESLLNFMIEFSAILMQQLSLDFSRRKYKYIKPFSRKNLEVVLVRMKTKYEEIVKNEGFLRIADAIRSSTISLMYQDKKERKYDVRYGMAQDIKRVAPYEEQFLAYISDFIASYNAENAREYEKTKKQYRKNVNQSDVNQLVILVDKFGSDVVSKLLAAMGYSSKERVNVDGEKGE